MLGGYWMVEAAYYLGCDRGDWERHRSAIAKAQIFVNTKNAKLFDK